MTWITSRPSGVYTGTKNIGNRTPTDQNTQHTELFKPGIDLNRKDDFGMAPIHHTVKNGSFNAIVELMGNGLDICECKDGFSQRSGLDLIHNNSHLKVKEKSELIEKVISKLLESKKVKETDALAYAAFYGLAKLVKPLLNAGADKDKVCSALSNHCPMHCAIRGNVGKHVDHIEIIEELIASGARLDRSYYNYNSSIECLDKIRHLSKEQKLPLIRAMIEKLMESEKNINKSYGFKRTLVNYADFYGLTELVSKLQEKGAILKPGQLSVPN